MTWAFVISFSCLPQSKIVSLLKSNNKKKQQWSDTLSFRIRFPGYRSGKRELWIDVFLYKFWSIFRISQIFSSKFYHFFASLNKSLLYKNIILLNFRTSQISDSVPFIQQLGDTTTTNNERVANITTSPKFNLKDSQNKYARRRYRYTDDDEQQIRSFIFALPKTPKNHQNWHQ